MPYPPATLAADLLSETDAETGVDDAEAFIEEGGTPGEGDHAERHNRTAEAVNDIVAELGANPSGASVTVQARMEALGLTLAAKADTTAVAEALAAKASKGELGAEEAARISGLAGKAAATHASTHQLGGADALTLPQYDPSDSLPGHISDLPGTTLAPTVKRLYLARYTVPKKREVKFVRFAVNTAGSAEDKVDVGVYKWVSGNKLERLGSSGVKLAPTNGIGSKVVEMTSVVTLEPGTIYYRGLGFETVTGSLSVLATLNNQGAVGDIFYSGSSSTPHPSRLYMFKESSVPMPTEITSLGGTTPCLWTVPSES